MSTTVDNKIVEMRFNNEQFERGIKQSTKSLNELQDSMRFMSDTSKLNLDKIFSNIDLSGITTSIENISERFSALGVVGMTIVSNLTTSAMNAISNVSRSITNLIIEGGKNRAQNIENAKFQLEGLGIAYADVYDAIDYAVTNTAYSLDAAAQAAAQLSSAGLDYKNVLFVHESDNKEITQMAMSLRAVSGVAAQTQSDYSMVARYFQDVANAGKVAGSTLTYMTQVLNLPVSNDLAEGLNAIVDGSYEASDSVVKNAKKITNGVKVSAAEVKEMVTKGLIDYDTFATIMFNKYADHAVEANKTLEGVTANIRAAFARIGEMFFQPIIANEGPLVNMLEQVRLKVKGLKPVLEPTAKAFTNLAINGINRLNEEIQKLDIDSVVSRISDASIKIMNSFDKLNIDLIIRNIKDLFSVVKSYISPVTAAFKEMFNFNFDGNTLRHFLIDLNEVINSLKLTAEGSEYLKRIFKGLFAVVDIVKQAFEALLIPIKSVFNLFSRDKQSIMDATGSFANFLVALDKVIAETKLFEIAAKKISNALVITIVVIKQLVKEGLEKIVEAFNKLKTLDFSSIQNFFESFKGLFSGDFKISNAFDALVGIFEHILGIGGSVLSVLGQIISTISGSLVQAFKNSKGEIIKDGILAYLIAKLPDILYNIKLFIGAFKDGFKGVFDLKFAKKFNELFFSLKTTLADFQNSLKASTMVSLASAIAILTVSLVALSGIDVGGLTKAAIAMGVLFTELTLAVNSINFKAITEGGIFSKTSSTLLSLAISMGILASAVKKLSDLNLIDMIVSVGAVEVMMMSLVKQLNKIKPNDLTKVSTTLIAFSVSISILASAVKKLANIDTVDMIFSLGAVEVMILSLVKALNSMPTTKLEVTATVMIAFAASIRILASAIKVLTNAAADTQSFILALGSLVVMMFSLVKVLESLSVLQGSIPKCAGVLIAFAASIRILASAMSVMTEAASDPWAFLEAFGAIELMLITLTTSVKSLSHLSKGLSAAAVSMVAMGVAVRLLASSMAVMTESAKDIPSFWQAFIVLEASLWSLVLAVKALSKVGPNVLIGAGAMIAMAASVKIIASAISQLDEATNALKSAGAIAIVLGLMEVFALLSQYTGVGLIEGSIGLIAFAAGLKLLVDPLVALSTADIGKVAGHLAAVLGIIIGFGAVLTVLPVLGIGLGILGAALLLIGAACLEAGAGMEMFGNGVLAFTTALEKITVLGDQAKTSVTNLLEAFSTLIIGLIPTMVVVVTEFIGAIADAITINAPKVTVAINALLDAAIASLMNLRLKFPLIVQLGTDFIIAMIEGLAKARVELTNAAIETVIYLINSLSEAIVTHTPELIAAFDNLVAAAVYALASWYQEFSVQGNSFVSELRRGIEEKINDIKEAAFNVVKGFIDEIKGNLISLVESGKEFASSFLKGLMGKDGLDEHSPSVKADNAAENFFLGFINNVNGNLGELEDAGISFGSTFSDSAGDSLESGGITLEKIISMVMGNMNDEVDSGMTQMENTISDRSARISSSLGSVMDSYQAVKNLTEKGFPSSYSDSINDTSKASEKATKTSNDFASALGNVEKSAGKAGKAAKETKTEFEKMYEKIEGSIDLFSEFNRETDMTSDQLLGNMKSQIEGMAEWSNQISMLAIKGIDQGLLQKLADMGPESYKYTSAFVSMTAEQLAQANTYYRTSLLIPGNVSTQIMGSYQVAGQNAASGFIMGVDTEKIRTAGENAAKAYLDAFTGPNGFDSHSPSRKTRQVGVWSVDGLKEGINDGSAVSSLKATITNLCRELVEKIRSDLSAQIFKNIGMQIPNGLVQGIAAGESDVVNEIIRMCESAVQQAKNSLSIHSPSRVFAKIGDYVDQGFAKGISDNSSVVNGSITDMAKSSIDLMKDAISSVYDIAVSDMDVQPTIRPVVDLSNIKSGMSSINSLTSNGTFGLNPALILNGINAGNVIENSELIANNDNSAVVDAIKSLKEDITGLKTSMSNIKMVLDSGTLVGEMVAPMDAALGQRAVYAGRGI